MTTHRPDKGWIGVDLDGTLATYDRWRGLHHIGDPVEPMVECIKGWLDEGYEVKIFTARVSGLHPLEREAFVGILHAWLVAAGLPRLDATNIKDFRMVELWDDRAVQVETNTGMPVGRLRKQKDLA